MLKIFLSSTFRDLKDTRSEILKKLDSVFEGVGMEEFIPDGSNSQEVCIGNLKKMKKDGIVIFLISPYYGSLMDSCSLKADCKAECSMKTGTGRISYTHCEYKTTLAEGILHQTYLIEEGWDKSEIRKEALQFRDEIGEEYLGFIDINDPNIIKLLCNNLAKKITEWHSKNKLKFAYFCDRVEELNDVIQNIDGKVEVYGIGGVGKTALIQVALLIEKLKGKRIISIGTTKTYASGSGFEDFRIKCKNEQFQTESRETITIHDIINTFSEAKLLLDLEEVKKYSMDEIIEYLSGIIRNQTNLVLFIDDFHLATDNVVKLVKLIDHVVFSSRKNTYIARKEIYITGIDEKERENLISLFSVEELPERVKEIIKQIAEGHPVSTELLVKNYQRIDFDKIKDFNLEDANEEQVGDFYERVIEEIFATNKDVLNLLKNLAILDIDLPTNIDRKSVQESYETEDARKVFNELIDTTMLKKKEGKEGTYEFYFKHIQDYLENRGIKENHEKAIQYYEKKKEIIGETIDDNVEVLYHKVKSNPTNKLAYEFIQIYKKIRPVYYGFNRLIDVGEELKLFLQGKEKALILKYLGNLYLTSRRFKEAEDRYLEALKDIELFAEKDSNFFYLESANVKYDLGHLYYVLHRFQDAAITFNEALEMYSILAEKDPENHLINVADTRHSLGTIYWKLKDYKNAEGMYLDALKVKKSLADQNPQVHLPNVVVTLNNLGILYDDLRRFEEAEKIYLDSLKIEKNLAERSPDKYLPTIAGLQNNLGALYRRIQKHREAEEMYINALSKKKISRTKSRSLFT